MAEEQKIKLELSVKEVDELHTSAVSMWMQLQADKHSHKEDVEFWYKLGDKLMMAKIRQGF